MRSMKKDAWGKGYGYEKKTSAQLKKILGKDVVKESKE